jgi:hypothetical protein
MILNQIRQVVVATVVAISVYSLPAAADTDTLLPITFKSFPNEIKRAFSKVSLKDNLIPVGCLPGDAQKRSVCSYKLGNFMSIMTSSAKGGSDVVSITMICSTADPVESSKCLLSYAAAMSLTSSALSGDTRGKILHLLLNGLEVGTSTTVVTEERKFILQKSLGIWFHVYAADEED